MGITHKKIRLEGKAHPEQCFMAMNFLPGGIRVQRISGGILWKTGLFYSLLGKRQKALSVYEQYRIFRPLRNGLPTVTFCIC